MVPTQLARQAGQAQMLADESPGFGGPGPGWSCLEWAPGWGLMGVDADVIRMSVLVLVSYRYE